MLALAAALGMFVFFGVVGFALLQVTVADRRPMTVLVAPAAGAALIVLPTMFLNYLGAPVRSFGPALAAVLLIAAVAVLVRMRPYRFPRSLYAIGAILIGALVLTGRPCLEFGFDWLSIVNDDMNTYVFGAARMFEHGFLGAPDATAYAQNRTAIESYYGLGVLYNNRTGVENLLAFWMAVLRLDGYHVYMPLVLALQLTMISAATGLTFFRSDGARVPVATAVALAVSPLVTLGTDLQLIAQVCGLGLMAAALGLFCSFGAGEPRTSFWRRCIACAVPVAGLAAVYPEIFPLFAVAAGTFFTAAALRRTVAPAAAFAWLGGVAVTTAVMLNFHISTFLEMISIMLAFGQGPGLAPGAFPFMLVPAGVANLFGLVPVSTVVAEPAMSVAIAVGFLLFGAVLAATAFSIARLDVAGCACFALLLIAPLLARHQNGFGLYKLAMYLQPFLIPTLLTWWAHWPPFVRLRRESAA